MKMLRDPQCLLSEGLAAIRVQFQVPASFPAAVLAEASEAFSGNVTESSLPCDS